MSESNTKGSIVCVGLGMTMGSHITPLSRNYIEQADVVFVACSNPVVELWVKEMNSDVRSLQTFYQEGKDRRLSYQEMVEAMMGEVRQGNKVVGAFYGHPGVFALPPHNVIKQARKEGFNAHMEPGISAEDCLYADLGIDPGRVGSQHYEASQFMLYSRVIDPTAYLILWQVGIAGDESCARYSTPSAYREVLFDVLTRTYSPEHNVALYECPTLPIHTPRIDWMPLKDFASARVSQETTMVIPPSREMTKNTEIEKILRELDSASAI